MAQVKAKKDAEELLEWVRTSTMEEELLGKVGVLRAAMRGLMVAGSKSFTHMLIALERYDSLLTALLQDAGERVGREFRALPFRCPDRKAHSNRPS